MNDRILYHGSRNGIKGAIAPTSRTNCDFGKGFYLGTESSQAQGIVCNELAPYFYKMNFRLSEIPDAKILQIDNEDWLYYVLYNRNGLNKLTGTKFYNKYAHLDDGKDVVIGYIADDKIKQILPMFINGYITDKAALECLRCIPYGIQFVAKTPFACSKIDILLERKMSKAEINEAINNEISNRLKCARIIEATRMKYLHEGRYLSEIIAEKQKVPISTKQSTSITKGLGLGLVPPGGPNSWPPQH